MNCLRARSSRASWSCMSSNAAASWPSSSSESAADRVEKSPAGDLARRALEPLDAQRQRARHEVAGEQRDHQRDRAGEQDLAADQADVGLHVGRARRRARRRRGRLAVSGAAASACAAASRVGSVAGRRAAWRRRASSATPWTSRAVDAAVRRGVRDQRQRRGGRREPARASSDLGARAGRRPSADAPHRAVAASGRPGARQRRRRRGGRAARRSRSALQLLVVQPVLQARRRRRGRRSPIAPSDDQPEDDRQPVAQRPQARHDRQLLLVAEPVADAAHREDVLRLLGVAPRSSRAGGGCGRRSCAGRGTPSRPTRARAACRA